MPGRTQHRDGTPNRPASPGPPLPEYQVVIEVFGGDTVEGANEPLQLRMKGIDGLEVVCALRRLAAIQPLMRHFPIDGEILIGPMLVSYQHRILGNRLGEIAFKIGL